MAAWQQVQEDSPVWRVTNGAFPSNCYIVDSGVPGQCFLVDPGLDPALVDQALAELALTPKAICCTHGHFDHAGGAAYFQKRYGCKVYLHDADTKTLRSSNFLLMAFKVPARVEQPELENIAACDFSVDIGTRRVRFLPAPGHTPGSCILQCGDSLFTGDTLYSRGIGLSKLPGEDPDLLRRSIHALWNTLPDGALVHPGHGDSARFEWIKRNNLALLAFLAPMATADESHHP